MAHFTRRQSFGLLAAASVPPTAAVAVAVAATHPETPSEKVARIGEELAHALNDYTGGKFHAVVYPSAQSDSPVSFISNNRLTAQTRFDHHLAQLKKAAEELDPGIGRWQTNTAWDGNFNCGVLITAFRVVGRYEGDGTYEAGSANRNGNRTKYQVRLLDEKMDGERAFDVRTAMDRMVLAESRFNTFIGRRLGKLKGGV